MTTDDVAAPLPRTMGERISFLLYRTAISATARADAALSEMGLTARAVGILTLVVEAEPMTQRSLGAAIGIDRSTMVILLDDLEARGYVRRARHPIDRRAFLIRPTARGSAVQKRAVKILDRCEAEFLEGLSDKDQSQLLHTLSFLHAKG